PAPPPFPYTTLFRSRLSPTRSHDREDPMELLTELLPALLRGSLVTIQLALASTVLGAVLAFAAGIGKLSRNRLVRWLSVVYVEIDRKSTRLNSSHVK